MVAIYSLLVYRFGTFFERVANQRSKLRQYLKPNLYKYARENNFTLKAVWLYNFSTWQSASLLLHSGNYWEIFFFLKFVLFINSNKYETNFRELDIQKKFKGFFTMSENQTHQFLSFELSKGYRYHREIGPKRFFCKESYQIWSSA